ncbi:uncharacterized protein BDZ99DRAFT_464023 [Mytilinidion resinicola]|uniref:DUF5648 domain-containing protein n=1 Tax=Mytilinidion resinicola TaxID=574789 RepID=A0A6A6YMP2_9PEZI|nr:uncharacterized protein BDZ99DRAFT_464023 [Mytilinidion resinicola]KAF2809245.1 hypothetical protein BDZ99DRAFT_464023 [Mytilinidion resinicola]
MLASAIILGLAANLATAADNNQMCDTYAYSTDCKTESASYWQQDGYLFQGVSAYVWPSYNSYKPFEVEEQEKEAKKQEQIAKCKAAHQSPTPTATPTPSWGGEKNGGEEKGGEQSEQEKCEAEHQEDNYPNLVPVYRWNRKESGDYYFTTDPNDLGSPYGYEYDGQKFFIIPDDDDSTNLEGQNDVVPFFEWYNADCGTHFYTTDPEGENAVNHGFKYEHILGWVRIQEGEGTEPLYRWSKEAESED